jgi:hypothetical protein
LLLVATVWAVESRSSPTMSPSASFVYGRSGVLTPSGFTIFVVSRRPDCSPKAYRSGRSAAASVTPTAATTLGVYAHFVAESDRDAATATGSVLQRKKSSK